MKPITKEESAYSAIRGAIIAGELVPGQAVSIRDLAKRFDLGRTPITDAMKHLALEGWLETAAGVGTRVASLNISDRYEYMQVRGALEALSVRLCAQQAQAETLLDFEHCMAVEQLAIESGDLVRAIDADIGFHRLCAQRSGNHFLNQHYGRLLSQDELVFFRNITNAEIRLQSHRQHEEIVRCIRSGDPDAAEQASRRHTETILERLRHEMPQA
jgi:DNA-binding GntR family transcriptional regulator